MKNCRMNNGMDDMFFNVNHAIDISSGIVQIHGTRELTN